MFQGIFASISAGIMNGLYAIPEKFTKDFKYENSWGLFFLIDLFIIPLACGILFINNYTEVLYSLSQRTLIIMFIASFFWGFGCQLWSKAIDYIGVSLGFSIFIGVIILVGSIIPFFISGLPTDKALFFIIIGLFIVLLGIIANGKAGILRKQIEQKNAEKEEPEKARNIASKTIKGIFIAIIGGLLATGFNLANAIGYKEINESMVAQGNSSTLSALAVMIIVYVSGSFYNIPFFCYKLFKNKSWKYFNSKYIIRNLSLVTLMGILNFGAAVTFAYGASVLGNAGNTVGYAIFNTAAVLVAVIGGLLTSEWDKSSSQSRKILYYALLAMIIGIVVISYGNSLNM